MLIRFKRIDVQKILFNRNRLTHTENKLLVTGGGGKDKSGAWD